MCETKCEKLKPVIVRATGAGVHFGYLVEETKTKVKLERSRRIWSWKGAKTLSEIATAGLDINSSNVASPVSITINGWVEIIECSDCAVKILEAAKWTRS